jgi:hypothetical protein
VDDLRFGRELRMEGQLLHKLLTKILDFTPKLSRFFAKIIDFKRKSGEKIAKHKNKCQTGPSQQNGSSQF